jgi:hypothetical protein
MTLASVPGSAGALLVLTAVALTAVDAGAQPVPARNFHTGMATGIGYAGVVPDAAAGGGAWHFLGSSGFGIFADGKVTTSRLSARSNYCPPALDECTVEWVSFNRPLDGAARDETTPPRP